MSLVLIHVHHLKHLKRLEDLPRWFPWRKRTDLIRRMAGGSAWCDARYRWTRTSRNRSFDAVGLRSKRRGKDGRSDRINELDVQVSEPEIPIEEECSGDL